jgi:hypothetical protein
LLAGVLRAGQLSKRTWLNGRAEWEREIANARIHGTMGEAPIARFLRDEAHRLAPLAARAPFGALRELSRVVGNDCAIAVDSNFYSVPWRLIGERVAVTIAAGMIRVRHGRRDVARHRLAHGKRLRIIDPAHLDGVAGRDGLVRRGVREASTAKSHRPAVTPCRSREVSLASRLTGASRLIGASRLTGSLRRIIICFVSVFGCRRLIRLQSC